MQKVYNSSLFYIAKIILSSAFVGFSMDVAYGEKSLHFLITIMLGIALIYSDKEKHDEIKVGFSKFLISLSENQGFTIWRHRVLSFTGFYFVGIFIISLLNFGFLYFLEPSPSFYFSILIGFGILTFWGNKLVKGWYWLHGKSYIFKNPEKIFNQTYLTACLVLLGNLFNIIIRSNYKIPENSFLYSDSVGALIAYASLVTTGYFVYRLFKNK